MMISIEIYKMLSVFIKDAKLIIMNVLMLRVEKAVL
jgi:hypothetical protein